MAVVIGLDPETIAVYGIRALRRIMVCAWPLALLFVTLVIFAITTVFLVRQVARARGRASPSLRGGPGAGDGFTPFILNDWIQHAHNEKRLEGVLPQDALNDFVGHKHSTPYLYALAVGALRRAPQRPPAGPPVEALPAGTALYAVHPARAAGACRPADGPQWYTTRLDDLGAIVAWKRSEPGAGPLARCEYRTTEPYNLAKLDGRYGLVELERWIQSRDDSYVPGMTDLGVGDNRIAARWLAAHRTEGGFDGWVETPGSILVPLAIKEVMLVSAPLKLEGRVEL